jgi:hypothetical protein
MYMMHILQGFRVLVQGRVRADAPNCSSMPTFNAFSNPRYGQRNRSRHFAMKVCYSVGGIKKVSRA